MYMTMMSTCPATCQAWPAGREAQLGEGLPAQEAGAAPRRLQKIIKE